MHKKSPHVFSEIKGWRKLEISQKVGHVGSVASSAERLQKICLLLSSITKCQASLGQTADGTPPAESVKKE